MMTKRIFLLVSVLAGMGLVSHTVLASTTIGTIDSTFKYAWGTTSGWVNFGATSSGVLIKDDVITGYAWSPNFGWINLAPATSGVKNNNEGTLSGKAWSPNAGWINFSGVVINSSGQFTGSASADLGGTVNFDCAGCKVTTDWRPASSRSSSGGGGGGGGGSVASPTTSTTRNIKEIIKQGGSITIVDFSVAAYWYNRPNPPATIDLNGDSKITIVDLSIMAYYYKK